MNERQARVSERCPVCKRQLVRVTEDGVTKALAHESPPCDEYTKLPLEAFLAKYMIN